jgi:hypothetical protein
VLWDNIVSINGNYIGDFDGAGISVTESWRAVSGDLILGKDPLSLFNLAFAETSAALGRPIPDDVDGAADEFSFPIAPSWLKPQACPFASTRHNPLIRSMFASVV